jgi:hypothetical protein
MGDRPMTKWIAKCGDPKHWWQDAYKMRYRDGAPIHQATLSAFVGPLLASRSD